MNTNRPKKIVKRSDEEDTEYINFKSQILYHICPVSNYYAVRAYLSDVAAEKVKHLPNVISCIKDKKIDLKDSFAPKKFNSTNLFKRENSKNGPLNKHYNLNEIKKETNWSGVSVQEFSPNDYRYSHLSLISQGRVDPELIEKYDNNYYYPTTAGKDIDMYLIDCGISMDYPYEFDTYEGTNDERSITCDAVIAWGHYEKLDANHCYIDSDDLLHGNIMASVAAGTKSGVAKKANIHMVAISLGYSDVLLAIDYILLNATPNKSVISISFGVWDDYRYDINNKIEDLIEAGFVFIADAGPNDVDVCVSRYYANYDIGDYVEYKYAFGAYDNVITVGSTDNTFDENYTNGYKKASFSNYGDCVDFYAPSNVLVGDDEYYSYTFTPHIVAGVAALYMGENPKVKHTQNSIREALREMALRDVVQETPDAPNYFINNGKHIVYSLKNSARTTITKTATVRQTKTSTTTSNATSTTDNKNVFDYIIARFKGTMKHSEYFLGTNELKPQNTFHLYELDKSVDPTYQYWLITSQNKPSIFYLSNATFLTQGNISNYCLDLGTYVNSEGYNYLSIVECSKVQHKFQYGGSQLNTIDIYTMDNKHLKDSEGYNLCLYYSMTPRISRCDYINDKTNKNAEHMKWEAYIYD